MTNETKKTAGPTTNPAEPLAPPKRQAGWFEAVRDAHQRETAEDYVELIADLIEAQGEARVSDLSARFGISHATVNKIIGRLNREGLVVNQPYRALFLTPEGKKLARYCKRRHEIVLGFLKKIGVPAPVAETDSEGIEHHVSPETLAVFKDFIGRDSS